jgi:uncharacterized protein (DUF305 family)
MAGGAATLDQYLALGAVDGLRLHVVHMTMRPTGSNPYAWFMPSIGMRIAALVAAVVTTAVMSACGESSPVVSDAQSTKHNAADLTFVQKMIPHHQQALEMAAMVPSRTTNPELLIMAKHIELDQQAQIDTLQALLQQWGARLAPDHMGHDGAMEGMVDAATMDKLPTLKGAEFDDLWLRSMIRHHEGAVAMAKPEVAQGENPATVKMAKIIIEWQQFEIGQMNAMLGPSE